MAEQKIAVVTGASSGIGRSTAIALAKVGNKVVVAARRDKEGEETLRLVKESGGEGIFARNCTKTRKHYDAMWNRN